MPLYEYECESERHRFEVIQKFSDPPVETCPTCGSKVHKLISSPAIQFKGSGWYITDYARKGSGSNGSTGEGGASKGSTGSGAAGSGDSKESKDSTGTKGSTGSGSTGSTGS